MSLSGFQDLTVEEFLGLLTTPDFRDVPRKYSPGPCLNVELFPGGFQSRRGLAQSFDLGVFTEAKHGEIFLKSDAAARYFLWLLNDNAIHQSQAGAATSLFTPTAGTTHFRVVAYGNRAYILFGNGAIGLAEPKIWDTANLDPLTVEGQSLGVMVAATSATAGQVTAGVHRISILYETRSGFRVPACPFGILTNTGNPADNDTVTIGWTTYRFKNILAQAYDVLIGGSASASFDNLKSAINDTGLEGTDYGTGTEVHPFFRARAKTATTLIVEAKIPNEDPAHLGLAEASAVLFWDFAKVLGGFYSHLAVNYVEYTAPGDFAIALSNIPLHADGSVVKKHIIMTEAALTEFRIARTIDDNATTSLTFSISDTQLAAQESVTDLESVRQPGPNLMNGFIYHDRLIGFDGTSRVHVSEVGKPHTFRSDVGYLDVAIDDGDRAIGGFAIRDTLYIVKGQRTYWTQDTGVDPVDWPIGEVGAFGSISVYGIAGEDSAHGLGSDWVVLSDFKGPMIFRGGAATFLGGNEEYCPIKADWDTQNYAQMHKAKVLVDVLAREILFFIPTGTDTTPKTVFVADYKEGLGKVKWSRRTTAGAEWRGFLTDYKNTSDVALLAYGASDKVWKFSDAAFKDDATDFPMNYRLGRFEAKGTGLTYFAGMEFKAVGGGTLNFEIFGPDGVTVVSPTGIVLATTPGKDYRKLFNVRKERIFLELSQASRTARFKMNMLTMFAKPDGVR